jgi:hypothetical protein
MIGDEFDKLAGTLYNRYSSSDTFFQRLFRVNNKNTSKQYLQKFFMQQEYIF